MKISSIVKHSRTRITSLVALLILAVLGSSWAVLRADVPRVASGTWAAAGEVVIPSGAVSVALADGRVVVAGGKSDGVLSPVISTYDPASGAWARVGDLVTARSGHAISVLNDGRVLIAGGTASDGPTFDIEIYDPANGTSVHAGDMTLARVDHAVATLKDGRVLIVGGSDGVSALNLAEIFDPATGQSVGVPNVMSTARVRATATAMIDGHVLVVGGNDGANDLASAEIFEPATGSFFGTGAMQVARSGHVAVLLPNNNQVLIAGGMSAGAAVASAELYADWRDGFSSTTPMSAARLGAIAGGLQAHDVAFVAGGGANTGDYYGYATVKTDKDDYAPYETVTISGSGWQPGETVKLKVSEDADTHYDFEYTAVADELGNIVNREFYPREDETYHHMGMRFYVTAVGVASQAQTTFTDGGTLTITFAGDGSGSVSGDGAGHQPNDFQDAGCSGSNGASCSLLYTSNGNADLTAVPASDSTFEGWSGACSGTETCTVRMNQNRSVTATFKKKATKTDQTITFGALGGKIYGDADFAVTATASSGLPVTFIAVGQCTISDNSVHISGAGTCTVTAQQAGDAAYNAAQPVSHTFSIAKATPVLTWANPTDIVYGTLLSATQLNATADVEGSFAYTPAAGVKLNAGPNQELSVAFTPTDAANYNGTSKTVQINVLKATPVITWATPADITYPTLLSATQLNAIADVDGTFAYTPAAGVKLNAGPNQELSVAFTPTDAANYNGTSKTVQINVLKATPVITWANLADIIYGTLLSATQLNATADVDGTFAYTPAAGVKLDAGPNQELSVAFTPTDAANYNGTSKTVQINVLKATPVITWATPADITYPTLLSATQLNATADVDGTFAYTPAAGVKLNAGPNQELSVAFTPTDAANYNGTSKTVQINVLKATPVITWANPADIIYGTLLSATQLNAIADVDGTFAYTPAAGVKLNAGPNQELSVAFTPTDAANYNGTSKTVQINVLKATPVITWATPADITYPTLLSATQLNAIADVDGTFAYTPAAGVKLNAGPNQELSVAFTPTDAANYNGTSKTVQINVLKATPVITWATPADITYPTLLSATQLNAIADVDGTFAYTPAAGVKLNAGPNQELSVTFTPADAANYNGASKTVQVNVLKATPVITWANPADIIYGTLLSATQLNATADVAGSFVYTPAADVKLNVGQNQTLSVTFTPTDTANYNGASKTVQINVVYGWDGFLQPINDTAHDLGPMSKFKAGQTIPAKFVLKNAAGSVVQQAGMPTFTRTEKLGACDSAAALENPELVSADVVPQYKWDGAQYHYNWSTKGLPAGLYRIFANLEDGTAHSVDICLTK